MHKAWRTLAIALGFGVITQSLFWDAPLGFNVFAFALIALGASHVARRPSKTGIALTVLALIAAGSIGFRASSWALGMGLPAAIAIGLCVLAAPASLADLPAALGRFVKGVPSGTADAARTIPAAVGNDARPFVVRGLLGVGLGLPIAGLFGGLLASDESFRDAVATGADRIGTVGGFAIASIATAFLSLAIALSVRAARAREAAVPVLGPYRHDPNAAPQIALPRPTLSVFTWGVVLGQVALVFFIFAIANAKHLFGGVAMIHADRSLTYASYLHSGFTELVIASSASVGLVVVGHALVTPYGETIVRGGRALAALEVTVLALGALTLASCAQRLFIYEDAYGATYRRLGVLVVGLVVLGVLAVTAFKSVRRGWAAWGGSTIATVLGVLALASAYDADRHIASRNLDRAAAGSALDRDYLASLGPDACTTLDHPVLRGDPDLRNRLRESWAAPDEGWRSRRGLVRCAR